MTQSNDERTAAVGIDELCTAEVRAIVGHHPDHDRRRSLGGPGTGGLAGGADGPSRAAAWVDHDLERAVDSIGAGKLLFSIADALAKALKNPQAAARAYRILLARLEGRTLDQIARREGVSRERIRQVALRTRRIVAANPELFEGFGGLEQAAHNEALGWDGRLRSRWWRQGIGEKPEATCVGPKASAVPARRLG